MNWPDPGLGKMGMVRFIGLGVWRYWGRKRGYLLGGEKFGVGFRIACFFFFLGGEKERKRMRKKKKNFFLKTHGTLLSYLLSNRIVTQRVGPRVCHLFVNA